jgi:hypothetical protein
MYEPDIEMFSLPVSFTAKCRVPSSRLTSTKISPRSVNFTAFPRRFSRTCRSRSGSPRRPGRGRLGGHVEEHLEPLGPGLGLEDRHGVLHQAVEVEVGHLHPRRCGIGNPTYYWRQIEASLKTAILMRLWNFNKMVVMTSLAEKF